MKKESIVKPLSSEKLANAPQLQTQTYAKQYKGKGMAKGKR